MSTVTLRVPQPPYPPRQQPPNRWMVVGYCDTATRLNNLFRRKGFRITVDTPPDLADDPNKWSWPRDSSIRRLDGTFLIPNEVDPKSETSLIERLSELLRARFPHFFTEEDDPFLYGSGFFSPQVRDAIEYYKQNQIPYIKGKSRIEGGNCFLFEVAGQPTAIVGEVSFALTYLALEEDGSLRTIREIDERWAYTHHLMAQELGVHPDRLFRIRQSHFHIDLSLNVVHGQILLHSDLMASDAAARHLPLIYSMRLRERGEQLTERLTREMREDLEHVGFPVHLVPGVFDPRPFRVDFAEVPVINFLNGLPVTPPEPGIRPLYVAPQSDRFPGTNSIFSSVMASLQPGTEVAFVNGQFDEFLTDLDGGLRCLTNGRF